MNEQETRRAVEAKRMKRKCRISSDRTHPISPIGYHLIS